MNPLNTVLKLFRITLLLCDTLSELALAFSNKFVLKLNVTTSKLFTIGLEGLS